MPISIKTIRGRQEYLPSAILGILVNPYYLLRRSLFQAIEALKGAMTGTLLDFGCGEKPYESLFTVDRHIGLDLALPGFEHLYPRVDVFYDGNVIPFEDEYFDSIFSSEVVEHIFNIDQIMRELHRVLKKGGRFMFTIPFAWGEHMKPYDFARYTTFGIRALLEKNNFEVIEIRKTSGSVEAIFQLWNAYLWQNLGCRGELIRMAVQLLLIAPLTLAGLALSRILPKSEDMYLSAVIVARKKEPFVVQ